MSRMDRYVDLEKEDNEEENSETLSRTKKNQEMYDEVYLNSSVVNDITKIMSDNENSDTEVKEEASYQEEVYEEKSYSVNDYIEKAHEKKIDDKATRSLDNNDFHSQEDEITRLIASIDEKDAEADFLSDLRGDNEDTMIGGQLKTDEFNTNIYEALKDEEMFTNTSITSLSKALGDETVFNLEKQEDEKLEHTFEKIVENDQKHYKKVKKLPIIVFGVSLFLLIIVVLLIVLFK